MKKVLFGIILTSLLLTSCEDVSKHYSYEFIISNYMADDKPVYVELSCPYNYNIISNDGKMIVNKEIQERDTILQVTPLGNRRILFQMEMNDNSSFTGNYKKDGIIPVWEYIKSIKVGDEVLKKENWKRTNQWTHDIEVVENIDNIYVISRYQLQIDINLLEEMIGN